MYLIMGYPNLVREEADEMAKKGERSLLLLCMLFAFACLLLSGGWRLVGSAQEDDLIPVRTYASIRTVLTNAGMRAEESASPVRRTPAAARMHVLPAQDHQALKNSVLSDANGNVLLGRTYMRAVYQAFALDDGFV